MDIYNFKFTNLDSEVFAYLCRRVCDLMSQRDIALALGVSPTAVANVVQRLHSAQIVQLQKLKTINLISLNRESREVLYLKRVENLRILYASGLVAYLETQFAGSTIIVFGSFSRGEDTSESDIDIAIIERKPKQVDFLQFEPKILRKIHLNTYNNWNEIPIQLKNNILNGIVLAGSIEL